VTVLKKWLLMSGKIQADIRHALGVSSGELSNQVSGKNGLSPRRQEEYAKFFGVSVEEFLRGPGASTSRSDQEKQSEGSRQKAEGGNDTNDQKDQKAKEQAPAGGDGKSGNNEEAPVRNKSGSRQPKEEPEVLDPMVVAVCEACRENVGDVECGKCLITKGLKKAREQETPGQITHNVKLAVCARCTHNARKKCLTCRMGMYWAAVEYYNQGKGITEAAREAESDYQAELAAKR
jgi:transcriptional regulator with XRE-family HTH domain